MKFVYFYKTNTPLNNIGIATLNNEFISDIFFEYEIENIKNNSDYIVKEIELIKQAYSQLLEYFNGKRKKFNLSILIDGTPFQISVWNKLKEIPYGTTKSYKDIAIEINNEKAVRAIGMANNKNKIPIIIPCHRVIGSNNRLIGYAGGLEIKNFLLNLEFENKYI